MTQRGIVHGFHPQTKIYSDSLTGWDFAERFGWVILLFPALDGEGNNRVTPSPPVPLSKTIFNYFASAESIQGGKIEIHPGASNMAGEGLTGCRSGNALQ